MSDAAPVVADQAPASSLSEPALPAEHAQAALARAVQYAEAADAPNTLRAYRSDWHAFVVWCRDPGLAPLPAAPETVGAYLAAHAQTYAVATLRRRLVTIAHAHKQAGISSFWPGHPDPLCCARRSAGGRTRVIVGDRLRRRSRRGCQIMSESGTKPIEFSHLADGVERLTSSAPL